MNRVFLIGAFLMMSVSAVFGQHSSPEELVTEIYATISGDAGEERDWDHFRSMFHEKARLGQVSTNAEGIAVMSPMTVEEYISLVGPYLIENGFFETERSSEYLRFGNMVHVWSTYDSRNTENGEVFMRGINSIQLIQVGDEWKVWTILWQPEQESIRLD